MTTWPYPPSQPSGDWEVSLPGDASIGELLVYQSEVAVPTSVLVPVATGSSAIVHRISGSGGIGSRYVLRCHFGSSLTPPTLPYTGELKFGPYQDNDTASGSTPVFHGTPGASPSVEIGSLVVTRPRAGAIEYAFTITAGVFAGWLEGAVSGAVYWAGVTVFNPADLATPWLTSDYRADTGAPNTYSGSGSTPDGYLAVLTGPDWPYPYFTGGTPP